MLNSNRFVEPLLIRLFIGLPLVSLFVGLMAWLRYGYDLPFFDDWRGYATSEMDSFHWSYLFRPANGAMAPLGVALDSLAQRYLDGNSIAYQALSMVVVLGSLLALQWHLLKNALGNRLHAAMCFVLTLFMLQPGSYWGRENLAYHQALPLVFLLSALVLIVHPTWRNRWRLPAISGLGVLAGLGYISGAFGACAAAAACVALAWLLPVSVYQNRLRSGGVALGLSGGTMAAVQYVFAALPYTRLASPDAIRTEGGRLALPHEAEFWFFYLGKIGRSLLLPTHEPVLSMVAVLLVCGVTLVLTICVIRRVLAKQTMQQPQLQTSDLPSVSQPDAQLVTVLVVLATTAAVYLMLIAAGRTHFRDASIQSATQVFAHGFTRFHFFWVTLLWPWVLAAFIVVLRKPRAEHPRLPKIGDPIKYAAVPLTLLLVGSMSYQGAFDHNREHQVQSASRRETIECLFTRLQSGKPIDCREFNMPDMTPAYVYATKVNASFVRYFPVLPTPIGANDPPPLYRFSRDSDGTRLVNLSLSGHSRSAATAANAPQIIIRTGEAEQMAGCKLLDVRLFIRPTMADVAKVFYKTPGQSQFDASAVQTQRLLPRGEPQLLTFRLESHSGFQDELRLDPVHHAQELDLYDVEVRCRSRIGAAPFFVFEPGVDKVRLVNMELDRSAQFAFRSQKDPNLIFSTGRSSEMSRCARLIFSVKIQTPRSQMAELFYLPKGAKEFSASASTATTVQVGNQAQRVVFDVSSPRGFEDEIRLDPVTDPLSFKVSDIQLSCLQYTNNSEPQPQRCDAGSGRP